MTTSLLSDAFTHHVWATQHLIDACAGLTDEQLETAVLGMYGTVIATFRHMLEADCFYLSVIRGQPAARDSLELSLDEMRAVFTSNGSAWTELLAGELDADADVVERDSGWEFHMSMGLRLAQVLQHGTDHRSQICTALTSFGVTPPEIDVWAFAEATGRWREVAPPAPLQ